MLGSQILEVAIGVIFVYLLVSIICSAVREGVEALTKTRAAYLERGLRELLHDPDGTGIVRTLYNHPLIYGLYSGSYEPRSNSDAPPLLARGRGLPSYIPSRNIALALLDIAARGPITGTLSSAPNAPVLSLYNVRANILNVGNAYVQRLLLTAMDSAQGDLNSAISAIEAWFDSGMDRVSGWYKRSTHWILFAVALVVSVGLNVNTITIGDYLYRNDEARAAVVEHAATAASDTAFLRRQYAQAKQDLDALSLPIGWGQGWGAPRPSNPQALSAWNDFVAPILGWLLTAIAATLGAPFWFDVLNKFMVVRSTVKPHQKSPEEASEDRQQPQAEETVVERQPAVAPAGDGAGAAAGAGPPVLAAAGPPDTDEDQDGCDVAMTAPTPDDALPAAQGGVA